MLNCLSKAKHAALDLLALQAAQAALDARYDNFHGLQDGIEIWEKLGFADPLGVSLLETDDFNSQLAAINREVMR